jgi:hypothetical protein
MVPSSHSPPSCPVAHPLSTNEDGNGQLQLTEIRGVLEDAGLLPKNDEEPREWPEPRGDHFRNGWFLHGKNKSPPFFLHGLKR